jgi:hypothetical protein
MVSKQRLYELRDELNALQSKSHKTADDLIRASTIADELSEVAVQHRRVEDKARRDLVDALGAPAEIGGSGFADALRRAGYDRRRSPIAQIEFKDATLIETKAATFDGDYADAVPTFRTSPPLGADQRFLAPVFPFQGVESDATSVSSFRQKSRTLPSLADMVRDIAAVTPKPEVDTVTEPPTNRCIRSR